MSTLILTLTPEMPGPSTEYGYTLTADGHTAQRNASASAALLPDPGRAGETVAVVPSRLLSWHRVTLPQGTGTQAPRLRAVLEGLLEERLLDEPEALHFAVQPNLRAESPTWVATCDRAWLRGAMQALEAAGRPATRIVPEFAPEREPVLYALGDPQEATLVLAGSEGVTALPLAASSLGLLPSLPESTPLIAEPAVATVAEQVMQHRPTLQHPAERWVRTAQSPWDLAQFDLSSSNRARAAKKFALAWADVLAAPQWRPARWGAVLLVAINLVGLNAWAWRERASLDAKREAMQRMLTTTFPQVKLVYDAPVQMEREVGLLRQAAGGSSPRDLEAMLGALSTAAPPQRAIAGLDYANGELRVKGMALGSEEVRSVAAAMKGQGYAASGTAEQLVITQETQP